jgi:hypothetical protein
MNRGRKEDLVSFCNFTWAALVARKFKLKVLRRSAHPFQHFQRNPKFAIALGAYRDSRRSSEPLQDS